MANLKLYLSELLQSVSLVGLHRYNISGYDEDLTTFKSSLTNRKLNCLLPADLWPLVFLCVVQSELFQPALPVHSLLSLQRCGPAADIHKKKCFCPAKGFVMSQCSFKPNL